MSKYKQVETAPAPQGGRAGIHGLSYVGPGLCLVE